MKVLINLIDPRFGGPQRSSLKVAEHLSDEGIETQFLVPDGVGQFPDIACKRGFTVHRPGLRRLSPPRQIIANTKYGTQFPIDVWKIRRIIERNGIDIVNARMSMSFQAVVGAIVSSSSLVWHFNDTVSPRPLASISSTMAQRYADEIVVSAENVIDYYSLENIKTTKIYPTVDMNEFNPRTSSSSLPGDVNVPSEAIVLGLIGNINPIKGYDIFLSAFEQIVTEYPHVVATIVGRKLATQKEYYQDLRTQVEESGLNDRVHFLGWQENIAEYLSAIDLFVMPSLSETGPMTLMEAMAMEKPIVTTNVGVVPEQLTDGEHMWIVDSGNSNQLATAIEDALLHQDQWTTLGENARKRAEDIFSVETAAQRYLNVYKSALK